MKSLKYFEQAEFFPNGKVDDKFGQANALKKLGRFEESEQKYLMLIKSYPSFLGAYLNLANQYIDMKLYDASFEILDKAISLFPKNIEILKSHAVACKENGDFNSAAKYFKKIVEISPENYEAYNHLGVLFFENGYIEEANYLLNKACNLNEKYAASYHNRALNCIKMLDLKRAQNDLKVAIKLKSNYSEAKYTKGIVDLLQGEYVSGFKRLDERMRSLYDDDIKWCKALPSHKNILIRTMKKLGLGDVVMYSMLFGDLYAIQKEIVIELDPRLKDLFERNFPFLNFMSAPELSDMNISDKFKVQTSIASIPKLINFNLDSFKPLETALKAKDEIYKNISKEYENRFGDSKLVGLAWHSTGAQGIFRSIPFKDLIQAIKPIDAQFISLQHGTEGGSNELIDDIFVDAQIDPMVNLEEYCAQIANLDLVITIDNSTAHFAAALGIKTILLLPFSPEWRWGLGSNESNWYKTISIIRQEKTGDWSLALAKTYALASNLLNN